MSSKGESAVPKFASFKRKAQPTPSSRESGNHEKLNYEQGGHSSKRRRHDSLKQAREISDTALVPVPENQEHEVQKKADSRHLIEIPHRVLSTQIAVDEVFEIDKRGDALIRRYGSNDRYKVPAYRRSGGGRLLGSNGFFRVDRNGNREEFYLRGFGGGASELSRDRKSVLAKTGRKGLNVVRVRPDQSQTFSGNEDFLPLKQSNNRQRSHSRPDESQAGEAPVYRSIHGMSRKHEDSDSDEAFGSDTGSEVDASGIIDPVKLKGIELNARVKDHPQDVDAWIELVEHQDVVRDLQCHKGCSPTPAEIKSYADIKHHMLEKALKYSKNTEQVAMLRLRIMREGSKLWDLRTIGQRWQQLLKEHGKDFEIWKSFVTFEQTNLTVLRYDRVKQLYTSKLRVLEKELIEQPSESRVALLCQQLIVVFSRLTQFIAEAGYSELATATWQAALEAHFQRPMSLANVAPEVALSSLQAFWESEAPRIGDDDAKGWAAFESADSGEESLKPKTFDNSGLLNTRDPYKAWAALEEHKSRDSRVPARTMDDGIEDDPFRVVMYSDIEELLFLVPSSMQSVVQEQLIDAFLVFCQMPAVFGTSATVEFLHQDRIIMGGKTSLVEESNEKQQDKERVVVKPPTFNHKYQSVAKSVEVMFPSQRWFQYVNVSCDDIPSGQINLVRNTLKQLFLSFRSSSLGTYCLSFDSISNNSSSKKLAKILLKQDPSNVDLYIGFARLEFAKGSKDAARNVISAALGLVGLTQEGRLRLCVTSTWLELEDLHFNQALFQLCRSMEDAKAEDNVSPAQVLKLTQFLVGNRDHLLSSRHADVAVLYTEAIALLSYLTGNSGKEPTSKTQGDIWLAMTSVSSCAVSLIARGFAKTLALERLLQFSAQLLYYHASHG